MLRRCGATAPSKRRAPGCAILRSFAKTRSCGTKAAYLGRFWVSLTGAAAFVVIAGSAVGFRFCPAKPSPAPGSDGRSTRGGTSVGSIRPDVVARKRKAASLRPSDSGAPGMGVGWRSSYQGPILAGLSVIFFYRLLPTPAVICKRRFQAPISLATGRRPRTHLELNKNPKGGDASFQGERASHTPSTRQNSADSGNFQGVLGGLALSCRA